MTSLSATNRTGMRSGFRSFAAALLALSLVSVGVVPSQAEAKGKTKAVKEQVDPREMDARQAFAAGNYKEALDIYAKLYAEKLHPTYLRNIGRCYQNLGEPDRAISSFREYLRKAKGLSTDERSEVEGYIGEMEDLQRKQASAAQPQPTPAPVAPPVAPSPAPAPQPALMLNQSALPPVAEPTPFYKRAWFWGVVSGVVVAATVGGLWAGGAFSAKSNNSCRAGFTCYNP
jgi:hypothetical protein